MLSLCFICLGDFICYRTRFFVLDVFQCFVVFDVCGGVWAFVCGVQMWLDVLDVFGCVGMFCNVVYAFVGVWRFWHIFEFIGEFRRALEVFESFRKVLCSLKNNPRIRRRGSARTCGLSKIIQG